MHPGNAEFAMEVTFAGIEMDDNFTQLEKAYCSIEVTVSGITTEVKLDQ